MRVSYSRWLGWLEKYQTEALDEDPVSRATLDRLTAWSQSLAHLASVSRLSQLAQVIRILSSAAPEADWTAARRLLRNPRYLANLTQSKRTIGRVEAGKTLGGVSYGYRIVRRLLDDGAEATGEREIDVDQAGIVRRIFAEYAAGQAPRRIAARLNAENVSGPRGGLWNASTINGSRQRRNGVLNNELYLGRII